MFSPLDEPGLVPTSSPDDIPPPEDSPPQPDAEYSGGFLGKTNGRAGLAPFCPEAVRKEDEAILGELMSGELSPARAAELVQTVLGRAFTDSNQPIGTTSQMLHVLQDVAPTVLAAAVGNMSRSGVFLMVLNAPREDQATHWAFILRGQLAVNLGLTTPAELAMLDTALASLLDAGEARRRAHKAGKVGDYAKLIAVAQAGERQFNAIIEQLRNRNHRRTQEVHVVGAGSVAIQMNSGTLPVGNDPNPVTNTGASPAEQGEGTRFFGKNELRPPDGP